MTFLEVPENTPDPALLAFFKQNFGFLPNVFRAQTLRPAMLESEVKVIEAILTKPGALSRRQKEAILMVVSAANLNVYCVTVHSQMLQMLGVSAEQSDQIAVNHQLAELPESDKALLDFALRLAKNPSAFAAEDLEVLRRHRFTDEQILEAVLMIGLTEFLNTVQMGVGAVPDFEPRKIFSLEEMNPSRDSGRPMIEVPLAEDSLPVDEGSKFSSWALRIAINTGIQHLRGRKATDSLEDEDPDFKPRNIQAWQDDPEESYSKEEMRKLVEKEIMRLPAKYRIVLMLRDIEELSTTEAANVLGLGVPALKARVLRGRFMLRESLAPYFTKQTGTRTNA